MNTKEKSKRGKAIIGIAMAAIMLASVFAAMVPTVSATGDYNNITRTPGTQKVLIGQQLNLTACNADPSVGPGNVSISRVEDCVEKELFYADSADKFDTAVLTTAGRYYVNWDSLDTTLNVSCLAGIYHTASAALAISDSVTKLELKATSAGVTKVVDSITQGTNLTTAFTTNLFGDDIVDLVITGPDGRMHSDARYKDPLNLANQSFDKLNVTWLQANYGNIDVGINTTGWKVGTYTFQIKTKPEQSRGLSAETAVKTLTVRKHAVDIKADKTSVIELEDVKLTVTGKVGNTIQISGPMGDTHVDFPADMDDNEPYNTTTGKMDPLKIDADGTRVFSVIFDETGSYTIKVTDKNTTATDTVDITVSEKGVTFDLPMTVVIGQKLTIRGTASSGTSVDIYVDKVLYKQLDDLIIEDGEFSEEVTVGVLLGMGVPGTVRLKAFIDGQYDVIVPATKNHAVPTASADGETAFLLTEPGLTAETSVAIVAQDDSFYVTGTAKGARKVDILTVAPRGTSGKGMEPTFTYPGITKKSPSVSEIDDTFSQKILVDDNADTGTYLVAVFSAGRDGYYGTTTTAKVLLAELEANYGAIGGKTQEQFVEMLIDLATQAGSDDLMWIGSIKVEGAKVELNPIADVALGAPLNVSGTTNREEGHIMLITVKGPVELTPHTASVESDGTFSATFDTTDAQVGTYTVKVDDGDGHTDDATVEILEEIVPIATPTAAPTVKPTAEPVPTAEPAPEPTPTPTPTPGFEAVFAIAGLLSIAYLVLRRRK